MTAKQYADAIREYTAAIEVSPPAGANLHIYYANRSAAKMGSKDYEGAAADARRSISLDPSFGKAYSRLGTALQQLGKFTEAVAAYEKALQLDPGNTVAKENLALCQTKLPRSSASSTATAPASSRAPMPGANPFAGALCVLHAERFQRCSYAQQCRDGRIRRAAKQSYAIGRDEQSCFLSNGSKFDVQSADDAKHDADDGQYGDGCPWQRWRRF